MPGTDQSYLVAAFFLLLALLYPFVALQRHRSTRARDRSLDRFARRVRLPVPDVLRARIRDQLAAYQLGADLGAAATLALVCIWALTLGRSVAASSWWALVAIGAVLVGCALGAGVAALRLAARPRDGGGPRVARPTAPQLADYVAPIELQGGRAVALLPSVVALVLATAAVAGVASPPLLLPAGLAALALTGLVFAEVGGRRILDAPQAAGSDLELAWSDAVRAHTLRAVVTVPIAIGCYTSAGLLSVVGFEVVDTASPVGVALVGIAVAGAVATVAAAGWTLTGAPHRHFRHRLWSDADVPGGSRVAEVRP